MKYVLVTMILAGALAAFVFAPRKSCPLPAKAVSKTQAMRQ